MRIIIELDDITDSRQLARVHSQLTKVLNIVEYAQKQVGNERATNGHSDRPTTYHSSAATIAGIIDSLGQEFTTSDVLEIAGKDRREAVKTALKRAKELGKITLVESGIGRKPSKYRKVLRQV